MKVLIAFVFAFLALPALAQTVSREDVIQIQGRLADMGYRAELGTVDGIMGPGTSRAIAAFQRDAGLPVTGEPSAELIAHLRQKQEAGWDRGQAVNTGPSFNCARATTQSELAICADPRLSRLDRDVAAAYAAALARSSADGEIRAAQRRWISLRDGCGSDRQCIDNAMTGQIYILSGY